MIDKATQISGLRLVRTAAMKDHKSLKDEEKRICCLFPQMNQRPQYRGGSLKQFEVGNTQRHGFLYYNSQSVAESDLRQYGGGGQPNASISPRIPTYAGPDSRITPRSLHILVNLR